MNCTELKLARTRRKIPGRAAAAALGLTIDGYYKKEHGDAEVYVSDAFALTHLFKLSFSEFIDIFFDGELPFLYEGSRNCNFSMQAFPIRAARLNAGLTPAQVAKAVGMSETTYRNREKGERSFTLYQCQTLSKLFGLSFDEFNDIFFRSSLPFRSDGALDYDFIISQERREINA